MYKFLSRLTLLILPVAGALSIALPATATALPQDAGAAAFTITAAAKCGPGEAHPTHYNNKVDENSCCPTSAGQMTGTNCFLAKYVNPVVNLLSAAVGVVVLASMIAGGIQYSTAGGDSGKVAAAKQRIINSLLALAGFIFLFAFLQWIVPGGIDF